MLGRILVLLRLFHRRSVFTGSDFLLENKVKNSKRFFIFTDFRGKTIYKEGDEV